MLCTITTKPLLHWTLKMKNFILTIGREIGLSATLRSEDETVGELRGSFLAHCVKIFNEHG